MESPDYELMIKKNLKTTSYEIHLNRNKGGLPCTLRVQTPFQLGLQPRFPPPPATTAITVAAPKTLV